MDFTKILLMCCAIMMIVVLGAFQAIMPINDEETTIKHKVVTVIITIALSVGVMFMFDY